MPPCCSSEGAHCTCQPLPRQFGHKPLAQQLLPRFIGLLCRATDLTALDMAILRAEAEHVDTTYGTSDVSLRSSHASLSYSAFPSGHASAVPPLVSPELLLTHITEEVEPAVALRRESSARSSAASVMGPLPASTAVDAWVAAQSAQTGRSRDERTGASLEQPVAENAAMQIVPPSALPVAQAYGAEKHTCMLPGSSKKARDPGAEGAGSLKAQAQAQAHQAQAHQALQLRATSLSGGGPHSRGGADGAAYVTAVVPTARAVPPTSGIAAAPGAAVPQQLQAAVSSASGHATAARGSAAAHTTTTRNVIDRPDAGTSPKKALGDEASALGSGAQLHDGCTAPGEGMCGKHVATWGATSAVASRDSAHDRGPFSKPAPSRSCKAIAPAGADAACENAQSDIGRHIFRLPAEAESEAAPKAVDGPAGKAPPDDAAAEQPRERSLSDVRRVDVDTDHADSVSLPYPCCHRMC